MKRVLGLVCWFAWVCVWGQTSTEISRKTIEIVRFLTPPRIDGILSEPEWQQAPVGDQFQQQFPFDTLLAKAQTRVMVGYDENHIYIAAECIDSFPGKYVVESLKRDFDLKRNDCFAVFIDPFNDQINGFTFAVNVYGAQREGLIENGGNFSTNLRWDNKWYSEVTRLHDRWIVEIKIPFKTIRFKPGTSVWGINFMRNAQKINETSVWNRVPLQFNVATLAYTGHLKWSTPPAKTGVNISLIPYAIGGIQHDYTQNKSEWRFNGGGDAKIAITSSLNLDLTFNSDFSQVEADRQVTNLTRFSLFFPEQRQFFLENSDLFSSFGFSKIRPFFSRRIGLANGQQVPIIGGARLSGKISKKWRIGAMNIQTAGSDAIGVEAQNYSVAAVQRQIFSRSNIGLIFINRQGFEGSAISRTDYNRIIGLDYDLNSKDNKWSGKFFWHQSISPDNNHNAFANASFVGYSTRNWFIMWNHEYVGRNYNAETGFVPRQFFRNDSSNIIVKRTYWRLEPQAERLFYPKNSPIYSVATGIYFDYYADSVFSPTEILLRAYVDLNFLNSAYFNFEYNEYFTHLPYPIDITGVGRPPLPDSSFHYRDVSATFLSNRRKRFAFDVHSAFGTFFNGTKLSYGASIYYRAQPWGNFSVAFSRDEVRLPEPYGHTFLTVISPRLEFTFRRNIFWTTFIQFYSQADLININSRFQWRFAPMSDLFVVYTDTYGSQKFNIQNRGVVVKLVYWLSL